MTIGTTLAINLRQAVSQELEFISFQEMTGATDVIIDGQLPGLGEYTLTLESFNTLSNVKSALKTDKINIIVTEPTEP